MISINVELYNSSGQLRSEKELANELCHRAYLETAEDGEQIDPDEYKQNTAMFEDLMRDVFAQKTPSDRSFVYYLEKVE